MNQSDHILELARHRRVLRAADVRENGWSPQLLIRLHQAGKLQRFARGLYGLPDVKFTEHQTLIEVSQRVPSLANPGTTHPFFNSLLKVLSVKRGTGDSLEVTARAYSLAGPIVNSRLTFSTGLHHSCFGYSDAQGLVSCRLIDTHPHGEAGEADHEPTDGILVASLQGKVTQDAIEWPTQITVKIKH